MYSNNIVNFQESTTILNACTKKSGNLLKAPRISSLSRIMMIKNVQSEFRSHKIIIKLQIELKIFRYKVPFLLYIYIMPILTMNRYLIICIFSFLSGKKLILRIQQRWRI